MVGMRRMVGMRGIRNFLMKTECRSLSHPAAAVQVRSGGEVADEEEVAAGEAGEAGKAGEAEAVVVVIRALCRNS
jgi:hypothetical protein